MKIAVWFLSLFPAEWLKKALYKKPSIAMVSILDMDELDRMSKLMETVNQRMHEITKIPPPDYGIKPNEIH